MASSNKAKDSSATKVCKRVPCEKTFDAAKTLQKKNLQKHHPVTLHEITYSKARLKQSIVKHLHSTLGKREWK